MPFNLPRIQGAPRRRRLPRRWLAIIGFLGAIALLWQPVLLGLAAFMTVRSPLEPADVILPLYHDPDSIPAAAAELYRRRFASRIILHRVEPNRLEELGLIPPAHEFWRTLLEAHGIPPHAIETRGTAGSDEVDLGRVLASFHRDTEPLRAIVIASAQRSRLSRDALRRGLEAAPIDLRLYPVTPTGVDERSWWSSRRGWIAYFDAYCLWLIRFVR